MASEAQIQNDLRTAMRAREMQKVYVLRGVLAAIKNLKVERITPELSDADVSGLVRKEINKRTEAISYAEKAGRSEIVDQNRAEKAILEAYLPVQLSPEDLEKVIASLATELGTTQIGPLM
ncbi:MAG: hypothetical protein A3J75_02040, partial [Acidobacteria bacterium RBG_16_68_9]